MNKLIVFVLGAASGSLLTWKLIEKKYKDLADEEIRSVIDRFNERAEIESRIVKVETSEKPIEKPSIKIEQVTSTKSFNREDSKQLAKKLGYDYSEDDKDILSEEKDGSIYIEPGNEYVEPYVISPDEFGETQYYENKSWTYYSDNVITDEIGCIVDEPEAIIGDALKHFGEYEDDAVHVRNENTECDYEIIKVDTSFAELNRRVIDDTTTGN